MARLESQRSAQVSAKLEEAYAPAQVVGLEHVVAQGQVTLSWTPVDKNTEGAELQFGLGGYRIFRKPDAESTFTLIASVEAEEVTFTDDTMRSGATYIYAVAAVDGQESPLQGASSADKEVKTIPSIPRGLVSNAKVNEIVLNWTSVLDEEAPKANENLAGYNIYRSIVDGAEYERIGQVGKDTTTYEDAAAERGTTYYYTVSAFDNSI